jgi:hypothetical protein
MELYVGHLKPEVNRGDLWAAFHKFGSVNYIRLREGHAFVVGASSSAISPLLPH